MNPFFGEETGKNCCGISTTTIPCLFGRFQKESLGMHASPQTMGSCHRSCSKFQTSPTEQAEIDAFIDDQLAKGYIHPTTSDQTSGVFFIPKKDGKKRMVQDYRYINSKTLKNNYPLPLIPELIDKIGDAKLFTKMDL